jgi:hypothetical protein
MDDRWFGLGDRGRYAAKCNSETPLGATKKGTFYGTSPYPLNSTLRALLPGTLSGSNQSVALNSAKLGI